MHIVDGFVALGGDLNNQTPVHGITVAEVAVLRMIHGQHAVTGMRLAGTTDRTMEEEYRRLLQTYPGKYAEKIRGYWRDNGAKFPRDIRDIPLAGTDLAAPLDVQLAALDSSAAAKLTSKKAKEKIVDDVMAEM